MSVYGERAKALFLEGYNCAQAVFAAFAPELGLDRETALKISSSFGGGMGRMREVCGAVSGMLMVAGMTDGSADPKDREAKAAHYALVRSLAGGFREENGSIVCRELLGLSAPEQSAVPDARTPAYYKKRPCLELVVDAAERAAALLAENKRQAGNAPQ